MRHLSDQTYLQHDFILWLSRGSSVWDADFFLKCGFTSTSHATTRSWLVFFFRNVSPFGWCQDADVGACCHFLPVSAWIPSSGVVYFIQAHTYVYIYIVSAKLRCCFQWGSLSQTINGRYPQISLVKVTAAIICSDEDEHLQLVHWLHHYNQTLYAVEMGKRPPQVNQMETFSREVSFCAEFSSTHWPSSAMSRLHLPANIKLQWQKPIRN